MNSLSMVVGADELGNDVSVLDEFEFPSLLHHAVESVLLQTPHTLLDDSVPNIPSVAISSRTCLNVKLHQHTNSRVVFTHQSHSMFEHFLRQFAVQHLITVNMNLGMLLELNQHNAVVVMLLVLKHDRVRVNLFVIVHLCWCLHAKRIETGLKVVDLHSAANVGMPEIKP